MSTSEHDDDAPLRLFPALARIAPDAFVAKDALLIGDVRIGPEASVWFGAIVRGDAERIRLGARSNLQDGVIVHADPGYPCLVGADVTVGHRAVLHGCTIEDGCLIGMSATIMNGAVIGAGSLVGAGAVVGEGKVIPPRSLVLGVPGKVARPLDDRLVERLRQGARHYVSAGRQYRAAGWDRRG